MIIPACSHDGDFSFKEDPKPYRPDPAVYQLVREGDILLRQGQGPLSTQIVRFMREKHVFSHCGIVCLINNKYTVVHCISPELSGIDGVQTQTLPEFFADVADSNVAIIRPRMDSLQRHKFTSEALRLLEKKIPFDHYFDMTDSSALYCSELIYTCYNNSMSTNPFEFKESAIFDLVKFDSFFNEKYFETVWQAKP